MAKMTRHAFTAGLIAAALAFRQEQDAAAAKANLRRSVGNNGDEFPEEVDEETLWEQFQGFVEDQGVLPVDDDSDIACFAGQRTGEPTFTLRGQDILASMLVRHWIALYEGLAPAPDRSKLAGAEAIAEKMEMYNTQKWAD